MYHAKKYNTTAWINKYLKENISLEQIKKNQQEAFELCLRDSLFKKITVNRQVLTNYDEDKNDKRIKLADSIQTSKTIFIYSTGSNDLLDSLDLSVKNIIHIFKTKKFNEKINKEIDKILRRIEKNIKRIIELNENAEIYMLGMYKPTKIAFLDRIIENYNEKLLKLCHKFEGNVSYIDNSNVTEVSKLNWMPNYKGQIKMGQNIINVMKQTSKIAL